MKSLLDQMAVDDKCNPLGHGKRVMSFSRVNITDKADRRVELCNARSLAYHFGAHFGSVMRMPSIIDWLNQAHAIFN